MSSVVPTVDRDKELLELAETVADQMRTRAAALSQKLIPYESSYVDAIYDLLDTGVLEIGPNVRAWRD